MRFFEISTLIFIKNSKLVILDPHFRLESLKITWNYTKSHKTEFFLLSKNVSKYQKSIFFKWPKFRSRQHLNFLKLAKFNVNLWENGKRYRKSDLTFWKFRISSFQSCHHLFSIFNPSPRKIASKLSHFCKMLILQKWLTLSQFLEVKSGNRENYDSDWGYKYK